MPKQISPETRLMGLTCVIRVCFAKQGMAATE